MDYATGRVKFAKQKENDTTLSLDSRLMMSQIGILFTVDMSMNGLNSLLSAKQVKI